MVSHCIFSLFVLEDWQINLHSQISSFLLCSVTFSRPSHHGWLMGAPITSLIRAPFPEEGNLWEVSLNNCGVPCLVCQSSTSTNMIRTSIFPLSPVITHIGISHLHIIRIFLQALHPHFDVVCHFRGLVCVCCSSGASWSPGLSSLFHNGICNGSTTFLCTIVSTRASLLAQLTGPAKLNPTSLTLPRGSSSLSNCCLKNKITSPGG